MLLNLHQYNKSLTYAVYWRNETPIFLQTILNNNIRLMQSIA